MSPPTSRPPSRSSGGAIARSAARSASTSSAGETERSVTRSRTSSLTHRAVTPNAQPARRAATPIAPRTPALARDASDDADVTAPVERASSTGPITRTTAPVKVRGEDLDAYPADVARSHHHAATTPPYQIALTDTTLA